MDASFQADVLIQALPYMQRYRGQTIVIKYGGAAMVDETLKECVMQDIVLLQTVGIRPILVHGGGKEINRALERMGIEPRFEQGLRVTDAETMHVVEMVLAGSTNKSIVSLINKAGGRAVGISGRDANLLLAERMLRDGVDIGLVGEITAVDPEILNTLSEAGYVPVVSSVASGPNGETYNINADHAAGEIAAALRATKLISLTDVVGLLGDVSDPSSLITTLTYWDAVKMVESRSIGSGMLPKLESCVMALRGGVERAHIIDGRVPHALLIEVFTDQGVGTMVHA